MQLNLIDLPADAVAPTSRRQHGRMRAGWEPVGHACRNCGGRLIQRENPDKTSVVRCPQCDSQAVGGHDALCCCGEEVSGLGRVWECFVNPNPTRANPQVVLVRERELARDIRDTKKHSSNPVRVPDFGG